MLIITIAIITSTCAQASEISDTCDTYKGLAETAMTGYQQGTTISDYRVWVKKYLTDAGFGMYYSKAIDMATLAWATPMYSGERSKDKATKLFGESIETICYKQFGGK